MNALTLVLTLVAQQPQDTVLLEPVVVTATRVSTPLDAVAAAVTVISGTSLRARGIRTVAEALRGTLGAAIVETASFGSQTSLFMRGGESDYVKVLLDGVPLNQPGGAYNLAHLTTDDVERIEIVRGPVSVLYGSDAVAGVIQIFTRVGAGAPRIDAEAGYGSVGTTHFGATLAGGRALGRGQVGYSLGVSRFSADGLFPVNSEYRNAVVTARVRVAPDSRSEAALTVRHRDDVFHYPTDGAGRVVDENQYTTDRGPTIGLDLGRKLSDRLELRALFGLAHTDGRLDDQPDGPDDTTGVYRFASDEHVRRRSAEIRANWQAGARTTITGGVALEEARLRSANVCEANFGAIGGPSDCSSPPLDKTRNNRAYFLHTLADIGPAVSVNGGVRIDDNQQFGTFVTWRGGVAWRLDGDTRLRASLGSGFKEPTFFENFATGFATGNPDLRPERSVSWEAGIEHTVPGTTVSFAVTYFDQRFRDLIVFDFTRTPSYVNVAEARASGVEAGVQWAPGTATLALNYTYLDTRVLEGGGDPTFATGRRLIRRPANALNLAVTTAATGRGTASLGVHFVGDRDDLDFATFPAARVTLAPRTRVDAAAEYVLRQGTPRLAVQARVENLFDDRGREIANFPVRGRWVFAGARLTFGGR
ncbi:MAG: TonB-dependent receptor plug domain-containing protein [Gemmatimonadales bacterium]